MTVASPPAKLPLVMYESLQSWRRTFLFHRGYIKSVFGEGQHLVMVRKKDLVKTIPPSSSIRLISCIPETNRLILLTKEAFFISYLQAGCSFEPNLKHTESFLTSPAMFLVKLHLQPTQQLLWWNYSTAGCEEHDCTLRYTCSSLIKIQSAHVWWKGHSEIDTYAGNVLSRVTSKYIHCHAGQKPLRTCEEQ